MPLPLLNLQNLQIIGAAEVDALETLRSARLVAPQEAPSWGAVEALPLERWLEVRRAPSCQRGDETGRGTATGTGETVDTIHINMGFTTHGAVSIDTDSNSDGRRHGETTILSAS